MVQKVSNKIQNMR